MDAVPHLLLVIFLHSSALAAYSQSIYHYDGISLPYVAVLARNLSLTNSPDLYPLIRLQEYGATARCFPDVANSSYFQLCFINTTSNAYTFSILTYDTTFDPKSVSYVNNSTARVVWSANRNRPVRENAVVRLEEDGDLSLRDGDGSLVWSTNTSNQGVAGISLDGWGNLVLSNSTNGTIWQSYDHPTDVLLQRQGLYPGMRLVSRASDADVSEGSYSLVMEAGGLAAYYNNTNAANEYDPYWIFGCYGQNDLFSVQHTCNDSFYLDFDGGNTPYLQFFNVPNSSRVLQDDSLKAPQLCKLNSSTCSTYGWYFQYFDVSSSTFSEISSLVYFLRLESNGFLRAHVYYYVNGDSALPTWLNKTVLLEDTDPCLPPGTCGAYGVCSTSGTCTCPSSANNSLDSFSILSSAPPLSNDRFAGCSPPRNLSCAKNTSTPNPQQHFLSLSGIDYFANTFAVPQNYTLLEDCLNICLQNCSCLAVFYHNRTGSCFPHSDKLATLRSVNNQSFLAFLKIENTDKPAQKSSIGTIVGVVIGVFAAISIMSAGVIWLYRARRRPNLQESDEDDDEASFLEQLSTLPTRYSYGDLQKITLNFGKTLGAGGFGKVYEGILPNGNRVAVKKLESLRQGKKEFRAEVAILGGIHHVNLVRLCGFCAEGPYRLLVYEYMQNGSLDRWISQDVEKPRLSWHSRYQIALGTAQGLAYLHNECAERIFHLDVKPQNILLDADFTAKVADFGLSRLVKRDESFVGTTMRGTPGYVAPEWLLQGGITEKADVYSFGMVLLEIVSDQKNLATTEDFVNHLCSVWKIKQAEDHDAAGDQLTNLTDLVRPARGNADEEQAHRMILTALQCIQEDPTTRPSMDKVTQMLKGTTDMAHLDVSKLYQGVYSALRTQTRPVENSNSSARIATSASSGGVILASGGVMSSVTILEGR